jgi:hypothetical protein
MPDSSFGKVGIDQDGMPGYMLGLIWQIILAAVDRILKSAVHFSPFPYTNNFLKNFLSLMELHVPVSVIHSVTR